MEGRIEGKYRTLSLKDLKSGNQYGYILDIDPNPFLMERSQSPAERKHNIVNAVMGFHPHFYEGPKPLI